jgi:4-oxalocrotonate tautomerase
MPRRSRSSGSSGCWRSDAVTNDVMKVLHYGEESVSVGFEEVEPSDWGKKVYPPDIVRKADTLYKKPGYEI